MPDAIQPAPEKPIVVGFVSDEEAKPLADIVRNHSPWPDSVHRVELRFDEDWSGNPAVWIVMITNDELNPSFQKIDEINKAAEELRSEIFRTGTERWPYIKIDTE